MTRPVFEPSEGRDISALDAHVRSLLRRPSPSGGGVQLPYAWLLRTDDQSESQAASASIFSVAQGATFFTSDDSIIDFTLVGGNQTINYTFLERGIYEIATHGVYDANFDGDLAIYTTNQDPIAYLGNAGGGLGASFPFEYSETQTRGQSQRHAYIDHHWVVVDTTPQALSFAGGNPTYRNLSGATRTLDAAYSICYQVVSFEA